MLIENYEQKIAILKVHLHLHTKVLFCWIMQEYAQGMFESFISL